MLEKCSHLNNTKKALVKNVLKVYIKCQDSTLKQYKSGG